MDWLLKMLALRIDDKAFLHLIRKWLKAGILEPDGTILDPVTGDAARRDCLARLGECLFTLCLRPVV